MGTHTFKFFGSSLILFQEVSLLIFLRIILIVSMYIVIVSCILFVYFCPSHFGGLPQMSGLSI